MNSQSAIVALRILAWIALIAGVLAALAVLMGGVEGGGRFFGEDARVTSGVITFAAAFLWVMVGAVVWAVLIVLAHAADCLTDIRDTLSRR